LSTGYASLQQPPDLAISRAQSDGAGCRSEPGPSGGLPD